MDERSPAVEREAGGVSVAGVPFGVGLSGVETGVTTGSIVSFDVWASAEVCVGAERSSLVFGGGASGAPGAGAGVVSGPEVRFASSSASRFACLSSSCSGEMLKRSAS